MLLQQTAFGKVGSVATGSELSSESVMHRKVHFVAHNDWTVSLLGLAAEDIFDTSDCIVFAFLQQTLDVRLLDDLEAARVGLGQLFGFLHQSVCDLHARKLSVL